MDIQTTTQVLLALIVALSLTINLEPPHLRLQLKALGDYIDGMTPKVQKGPKIKANIYTAALFGLFVTVVLGLITYGLIRLLNMSTKTTLIIGIIVLLIAKVINSMQIDRVHAHISTHKDRFRK